MNKLIDEHVHSFAIVFIEWSTTQFQYLLNNRRDFDILHDNIGN